MVAYSFKARFRDPILAGTKRQTIRAERKRHARPGEAVQLYTGMRTRHCRIIGTALCTAALPIRIGVTSGWVKIAMRATQRTDELDAFARSDGFDCWSDMRLFWLVEHPDVDVFSGVLIKWGVLREGRDPACERREAGNA